MIGGIATLTIGFFVARSVASGLDGRMAAGAKGHATSLYLISYYAGSSIIGAIGGWFWTAGGWPAVAALAGALLAIAFAACLMASAPAARIIQTAHLRCCRTLRCRSRDG